MERIYVNGSTSYDIVIDRDILSVIGEWIKMTLPQVKKILVVVDENTYRLYYPILFRSLEFTGYEVIPHIIINSSEHEKELSAVSNIYFSAMNAKLTRNDAIIALGGGIVGDIAGFAASSYMRGVNFIQVPTTLIAQTDSAIGGKCGVNFCGTKNMIGAFYNPKLVYIDTDTLDTLPMRELYAGFAEIIKYACIRDLEMFEMLMGDEYNIEEIILRCVTIKRDIVEKDERDMGLRHVLNFGHTIAHAIEECTEHTLLHGEAVAIGMCAMARVGEHLGTTKKGTADKLAAICKKYRLKTELDPKWDLMKYIVNDKKRTDDSIRAVFLTGIGCCIISSIKIDDLQKAIYG